MAFKLREIIQCPEYAKLLGSDRSQEIMFPTPTTRHADGFCRTCNTSVSGSSPSSAGFAYAYRTRACESSTSMASRKCSATCVRRASESDREFPGWQKVLARRSSWFQVPEPATTTRQPRTNVCIQTRWRPKSTIPWYESM